ncbi:MAG: hypothetical protein RMJ98_22315, partial [Myxococcales bacterium]|nr:hypothetical protein [Myxococcales bacterium]
LGCGHRRVTARYSSTFLGGCVTPTSFAIPKDIKPGIYTLQWAIVDDDGEPAMNIAIEGKDSPSPSAYGRYTAGKVQIE